ncbi:MAG: C39 family peptidase [Caldilineaceae bacterium]|nr:C39 family peptidase [Caldilineaceae bacterium]
MNSSTLRAVTPLYLALTLTSATLVVLVLAAGLAMRRSAPPAGADVASLPPTFTPTSTLAPTSTPGPTSTPIPASTPTPTITPAPTATSDFAPAGKGIALGGITHAWQTWNNCGPATLSMLLSAYGSTLDQATIGAVLRLHEDDKNVGPHELAAYAREQGYRAQVRINGTADLLRLLLSNGTPVLVETWHEAEPGDGLGHYRLLTGYDDAAGYWIAYDSYDAANLIAPDGPYQGIRLPYAAFDADWRVFNRTYLLIYPPEREALLTAMAGPPAPEAESWQAALETARMEAAAQPNDAFARFNAGNALLALGRSGDAATAFDEARSLGLPWRMLWYQFGPLEAYYAQGRYADVAELARTTIGSGADIEELHYWLGMAISAQGDAAGATSAWQHALSLNPGYAPVLDALTAYADGAGATVTD